MSYAGRKFVFTVPCICSALVFAAEVNKTKLTAATRIATASTAMRPRRNRNWLQTKALKLLGGQNGVRCEPADLAERDQRGED